MVTPAGLAVLTDRRLAAGSLRAVVEAAVRGGAGWVILRERDLPYATRRALADDLRGVVPPGRLIDAVHLAEADPLPGPGVALVGRSRHDVVTPSEEDYVTLSPVFPTVTKPGYGPPLGPTSAARLAGVVPWLALGGIDSAERVAACAAAGAAGIAVLGAVMRSGDPARTAAELSAAFLAGCGQPPKDVGPGCLSGPTQFGVGAVEWPAGAASTDCGQPSKNVGPGWLASPTQSGVGVGR
jgi:thiamine monophosphate synthase